MGLKKPDSDPIEIRELRGVRTLHFGSDGVQGAMRLARPWALELTYTREMMAALLLCTDWPQPPRRILQIGLGAASLTRFIHRYLPQSQQVVVEQSLPVVVAARQYFMLPEEDARLQIVVADGVDWLAQTDKSFDLILVDAFNGEGGLWRLEREPFYASCREHLIPDGVLSVNLLSSSDNFLSACLALDAAFAGHSCLLPQTPSGNVIALASKSDTAMLDAVDLAARVTALDEATGLDLSPLVERLLVQEDGLPFGL